MKEPISDKKEKGLSLHTILEDCKPQVCNVQSRNSIVDIGNKIEFRGEVILLPNQQAQMPKAAEEVLSRLRSGDIQPTKIIEAHPEESGSTS